MEKVQWNSINKKQNCLKYSKNDKSSTLPRSYTPNIKIIRSLQNCNIIVFIIQAVGTNDLGFKNSVKYYVDDNVHKEKSKYFINLLNYM